jgi:DNA-nicking Smr family endonuclease
VKKKYSATNKDKEEWKTFTENFEGIYDKDSINKTKKRKINQVKKLDLHGFSLKDANEKVEKFIVEAFDNGHSELLIVTGKGLRSKTYKDPYLSEKFSMLKNSIPEYISSNKNLSEKIHNIKKAAPKDGGDGAIYIFLKKN